MELNDQPRRVDLRAMLSELAADRDRLTVRVEELTAENEELRARLEVYQVTPVWHEGKVTEYFYHVEDSTRQKPT